MPSAASVFNLAGSVSSVFGSAFVIVTHLFLGLKQDSVRTKLILSLALADFFNALDNATSGIAVLNGWKLDGPWCTVNGFLGQWTVVTSDWTVFAIAVSTVVALRSPLRWHQNIFWVQRHTWILLVGLWMYALVTAVVALFTVGYVKSAANWCWIAPAPTHYRYLLAHGPRIFIIFSISFMYLWIYSLLRRQAKEREDPASGASPSFAASASVEKGSGTVVGSGASSGGTVGIRRDRLYKIMSMMLIFPVVYTSLWIPGIFLRFYNMATNGGSNPVLNVLQGFTQWIGFANAVLYGLNEEVKAGFRARFRKTR